VIEILRPGLLTTVQDLGRPGYGSLGVGASGAADRGSLRLANRLVANVEAAAALELTFGSLTARFHTAGTIALTGAPCPATVDRRTVSMNGPISVRAGQRLEVSTPAQGLRTYLAVRGGIDLPPVLGSRSTDTLSGLGPAPLTTGSCLPIGRETDGDPVVDLAPVRGLAPDTALRILPGPHDNWFTAGALATLCSAPYQVTEHVNRVGARLSGPVLERAIGAEMPSEGMVNGALQVPPNGQPVLFLADHPVTGGYPVIAVVIDQDIDHAAQLRPGQTLRFRQVGGRPQ